MKLGIITKKKLKNDKIAKVNPMVSKKSPKIDGILF